MPGFAPLQTETGTSIKEEWGKYRETRTDGGDVTAFSRESTTTLSEFEADEEMNVATEEEEDQIDSGSLTPTGPTSNDACAALLASLAIPFYPFEGLKAPSVSPSPSAFHGQSTRSVSAASGASEELGVSRSTSVFKTEDEDMKPDISAQSSRASSTSSFNSYLTSSSSSSSSTFESSTTPSIFDIEDLKPDIKPKSEFLIPTLPLRQPKSKSKIRDPIERAQKRSDGLIRKERDTAPSPSPSIHYIRSEEKEIMRVMEKVEEEEVEERVVIAEDLDQSDRIRMEMEAEMDGGEVPRGDFTMIRGEKEPFSGAPDDTPVESE